MRIELIYPNIDGDVRENFVRVKDKLESESLLRGQWKFIDTSFSSNVTATPIPHGLKFVPLDVIQVHLSGTGALTWVYASFDETNIYVTTSGTSASNPLRVRAFIGRYAEGV